MRGAGGGEGAVWSDPLGGAAGDIAVQREDTGGGGEEHRVVALLEEMWRRRRKEMDRQVQGSAHQ